MHENENGQHEPAPSLKTDVRRRQLCDLNAQPRTGGSRVASELGPYLGERYIWVGVHVRRPAARLCWWHLCFRLEVGLEKKGGRGGREGGGEGNRESFRRDHVGDM